MEAGPVLRRASVLSPAGLLYLLGAAFATEAPSFQDAWRAEYDRYATASEAEGYPGWEATVLRQIVDLREIAEQGQMENEGRYFGLDSPRGSRWYNFDPSGFLECAAVGTYGGWEPGDEGGRTLVPGPVMVMDEDGQLEERDPQDVPRPVFEIAQVTWADFREFLWSGQLYE